MDFMFLVNGTLLSRVNAAIMAVKIAPINLKMKEKFGYE
jgi:hypothetical protein